MANLIGPEEARLLALERRQMRMGDDLRALKRAAIELGQQSWDDAGARKLYAPVVLVPQGPPPANTTVKGSVASCATFGNTGNTVTITRDSDGVVLFTGTVADDGTYTASFYMPSSTAVHVSGTSVYSKISYTSKAFTLAVGPGNNGISPTKVIDPAYVCFGGRCPAPLSTGPIAVTRSYGPDRSLTWSNFTGVGLCWNETVPFSGASQWLTTGGVFRDQTPTETTFTLTSLTCSPFRAVYTDTNGRVATLTQ